MRYKKLALLCTACAIAASHAHAGYLIDLNLAVQDKEHSVIVKKIHLTSAKIAEFNFKEGDQILPEKGGHIVIDDTENDEPMDSEISKNIYWWLHQPEKAEDKFDEDVLKKFQYIIFEWKKEEYSLCFSSQEKPELCFFNFLPRKVGQPALQGSSFVGEFSEQDVYLNFK